MPYGTAAAKLKKLVLFNLLQRFNLDCCFRCSTKIEKASDLSIDHKIPWLDNDVSLFWDLDNIAFSHLSCNSSNRRSNPITKKSIKNGTAWCQDCKKFRPIIEFGFVKGSSSRQGLNKRCKVHLRESVYKYRNR